ncbi:PqqD family protein [Erythrobacter tepidarius]|uniref:PqqD family protein n=1 Tax=Erythrobacter tepidarius TaxID=60454 RepID=UPI000A37A09B|nr:PqqD family protein [Erythrobacter tepidarius]
MTTLDQRFQMSDDVIAREVAGEMVLLDLASGLYFGLDPVGSRIWECLSESSCTLTKVCDVIEAEYDAPRARIEEDILALAAQLTDKGLITPV